MRNATRVPGGVETPGPTRPFAMGDWQSIGAGAGVELQQEDSVVRGGFDSGHEEQSIHQVQGLDTTVGGVGSFKAGGWRK